MAYLDALNDDGGAFYKGTNKKIRKFLYDKNDRNMKVFLEALDECEEEFRLLDTNLLEGDRCCDADG